MEKKKQKKNEQKFIKGIVIHGEKIGRKLGFPTINIKPDKNQINAIEGVYACKISLAGNEDLYGILHYGSSPTFKREHKLIEVYVFDYESELYDKEVEVEFISYIRPTKKFSSKEEIIAQITKDVLNARDILKKRGAF